MTRIGKRRHREAAAGPSGREPPPGSPAERLQAAFVRLARTHRAYDRLELTEFDQLDVGRASYAEATAANKLEWRRHELFERLRAATLPPEEESAREAQLLRSGWQGLLAAFAEDQDAFIPLTDAERECAAALTRLLTEMVQAAAAAADPAEAAAVARLEETARIFAAFDAKQAAVLADPLLDDEQKTERLAEWTERQHQYADRLFAQGDG